MISSDTYIKRDYDSCFFPDAYADGHQFFLRSFVLTPTDEQLVSMVESGIIDTSRDVPMLENLLELRFVSIRMLKELYPNLSEVELEDWMENLVAARVLNKFVINQHRREYGDEYPTDGLDYYCLDAGGKRILTMYGHPACLPERWSVGNVSMGMARLSVHLALTELYISLKKACKQNLSYFETGKALKYAGGTARFSGEFGVQYKDGVRHYLCSVALTDKLVPDFRDELDNTIAFMTSKALKAHFADEPDTPVVMLIITENNEIAEYIAEMIELKTAALDADIVFRFVTEADLKEGLNGTAALMRYVPENEETGEAAAMKHVRTSVFVDTDWSSLSPAQ